MIIDAAIQRAESIPQEEFRISAAEWNDAIEVYNSCRPVVIRGWSGGGWAHPWEVTPFWSGERERWECTIHPGYVNGLDTEVIVRREQAPEETIERIGEGETVAAYLAELPRIPLSALRRIGGDAAPIGVSGDGALSYESAPSFFRALGAADGLMVDDDNRRLLRACDIVLTVPRAAARAEWATGAGIDGTFAQFSVLYSPEPERRNGRISIVPRYDPAPPPDDAAMLRGDIDDRPFDQLLVATVYLLSPAQAESGSMPDASWSAHVRHGLFWNLSHAVNRQPFAPAGDNLTFPAPLAGGVGQALINSLLAVINDNAAAIRAYLSRRALTGRFWSV